jgi:predicted nucleic acid-binding protein
MSVVSNSSPLIALAVIGSLDLLQALYGEIHIPEEVFTEVVIRGAGRPGASEVAGARWIVRHALVNRLVVAQLLDSGIDAGESEAIALATELSARLLILDERRGRSVARERNLLVTGTLGVLIAAKYSGLVPAIKPLLDGLLVAGVYLDAQLIETALQLAGEGSRT